MFPFAKCFEAMWHFAITKVCPTLVLHLRVVLWQVLHLAGVATLVFRVGIRLERGFKQLAHPHTVHRHGGHDAVGRTCGGRTCEEGLGTHYSPQTCSGDNLSLCHSPLALFNSAVRSSSWEDHFWHSPACACRLSWHSCQVSRVLALERAWPS